MIGEQLLAGGIPALRAAIDKQNEQAKAEGTRAVSAAPLIVIAERLWPALRAADWRDRAEAALADLAELDLRDLRSVVVAADGGAKDEESRALATQLRDGLTQRLDQEQSAWLTELTDTLREGRVVRALRLSSRPPKAGAPLPAELATKLAEATSASLTADTVVDRWATVLDALSFSPARLTVVPASKPEEPSAELVAVITRFADRVPKVAEAFGIDPTAAPRRSRGGRGGAGAGRRPGGKGGATAAGTAKGGKPKSPPIPPPPPLAEATRADAPAGAAAPTEGVPTEAPTTETPTPSVETVDAPPTETAVAEAPSEAPADAEPVSEAPVTPVVDAEPAPVAEAIADEVAAATVADVAEVEVPTAEPEPTVVTSPEAPPVDEPAAPEEPS